MAIIGGALRLAGTGLGMLAKPGVGGQIARTVAEGAALSGAAAAAPTVFNVLTGDAVGDAKKRLAAQDVLEGENYSIGLGDRFTSTVSQMLGGEGIDQAGIKATAGKIEDKKVKDAFKSKIEAFGGTFTPGMSSGEAALALQNAQTNKKETDYRSSQAYKDAVEARDYNRTIAEIAREDRLASQSEAREDRLLDRRQNLDMAMANLAFKEAESKRQFDITSKRNHRERMASILAGLGALGGSFAIG